MLLSVYPHQSRQATHRDTGAYRDAPTPGLLMLAARRSRSPAVPWPGYLCAGPVAAAARTWWSLSSAITGQWYSVIEAEGRFIGLFLHSFTLENVT